MAAMRKQILGEGGIIVEGRRASPKQPIVVADL